MSTSSSAVSPPHRQTHRAVHGDVRERIPRCILRQHGLVLDLKDHIADREAGLLRGAALEDSADRRCRHDGVRARRLARRVRLTHDEAKLRGDPFADHRARHRVGVGADRVHRAEPPVVIVGEHRLRLALHQKQADVLRAGFLIVVPRRCDHRRRMADRQDGERLCHLRMTACEEPGHDRPPVVPSDVGAVAPESLDHPDHVLHQVGDRVVLDSARRIAQAIAPQVRRDRQRTGLRQRLDLFGPRLGAFWKPMQQDCELALRRSVHHRPKAQAVGLDHVLAGRHLNCELMKSVATSSAWSSTLSSPCPWPLKISSRALGMSLIFSFSSARSANGSLSPLRKSVGQRI